MHPMMLRSIVESCRKHQAEGDCRTPRVFSIEQLEDAVVELAKGRFAGSMFDGEEECEAGVLHPEAPASPLAGMGAEEGKP